MECFGDLNKEDVHSWNIVLEKFITAISKISGKEDLVRQGRSLEQIMTEYALIIKNKDTILPNNQLIDLDKQLNQFEESVKNVLPNKQQRLIATNTFKSNETHPFFLQTVLSNFSKLA